MDKPDIFTKTKWIIDTINSQIGFKVKYLLFSNVRGHFKEFHANIYTKGDDFRTAEIKFQINPATIDTGIEQRDAHLRNTEFFDIAGFKEITFSAHTFVEIEEEGHYELYGNLTMKGITNEVKLDAEAGGLIKDPWGSEKALFSVTGVINRRDWGFNWNTDLENGGLLVSDEVWIACEVQLIKQ